MAISLERVRTDEAGLPVVCWIEDRNLFAPDGGATARIECRILKDAGTRRLLFVARGSVRAGLYEEGRPWEALVGFSSDSADKHYYSAGELRLREVATQRSAGLKLLLGDGAFLTLASFNDEQPTLSMHINCASAAPAEVANLQSVLTREFTGARRDELVRARCHGLYVWPEGDERLGTYNPARESPPLAISAKVANAFLGAVIGVATLGGAVLLVYLVLTLFGGVMR